MEIDEYEKKWDKLMKDIKGSVPVDKDMVSELAGVQAALEQLGKAKTTVDKAGAEMRKGLILALSAGKTLTKELASFAAASKKADKVQALTPDTEKKLKIYTDRAEALRNELGNYEK